MIRFVIITLRLSVLLTIHLVFLNSDYLIDKDHKLRLIVGITNSSGTVVIVTTINRDIL